MSKKKNPYTMYKKNKVTILQYYKQLSNRILQYYCMKVNKQI